CLVALDAGGLNAALVCADDQLRKLDDLLAGVIQCHLFLLLLIGYVLQQTPFVPGSSEDVLASIILFIVLAALAVLLVLTAIVFVRRYVRSYQRVRMQQKAEN